MNRTITYSLVAGMLMSAATLSPLAAQGQQPTYKRDLPAKLVKQATVAEADAAKMAAAKIPNGTIRAVELENEGGKLIYSYELKVPGHSGIEEVNVDAKTGAVVSTEHEDAKAEAKESRAEKAGAHPTKPHAGEK